MDGFQVGSAEMRQAAQQMSEKRADATAQGSGLMSDCTAVANTPSWQGSAAISFGKLMVRYDEDLKKLLQALEEIETQLIGAATDVDAQQQASADNMNRITGVLGG
jgi:WXG100 family type VII secretion target